LPVTHHDHEVRLKSKSRELGLLGESGRRGLDLGHAQELADLGIRQAPEPREVWALFHGLSTGRVHKEASVSDVWVQ
jgi:hypothetical protein